MMQNVEFYNPTRTVFGNETIAKLDTLVASDARVLVPFGGERARKNGTLDEVRAALNGRAVHEFDGIEPNPSYETLMQAVDPIREQKFDFLPAVGGGSVLDGATFVADAAQTKLAFTSPLVFPLFFVLDPTKTFTLPPQQNAFLKQFFEPTRKEAP